MSTYSTFIDGVTAPDGTTSPGEPDVERQVEANDENDAARQACAAYLLESGSVPQGSSVRVLVLRHRSHRPAKAPEQWTFDLDVWGKQPARVH